MKSIIPVVSSFAFVVPVYDYVSVDDLAPAVDLDCVGWVPYFWNADLSGWEEGELEDTHECAQERALEHHQMMRRHYNVADDVKEPENDVPDAEPDEDETDEGEDTRL